jgi:hypothetical protein
VTNVTDKGGGYGGGWGESQDEFKRRVMGKKRDFSVDCVLVGLLCAACLIPFGHQHFFINQEIQSPTPQEKQPSAQITKATIDSGFKRFKDFLEQALVACVIQDLAQTFIGNHKPSDGWQCAMNALQNPPRSYQ